MVDMKTVSRFELEESPHEIVVCDPSKIVYFEIQANQYGHASFFVHVESLSTMNPMRGKFKIYGSHFPIHEPEASHMLSTRIGSKVWHLYMIGPWKPHDTNDLGYYD